MSDSRGRHSGIRMPTGPSPSGSVQGEMTSQFEAATSHLRNHGGYVHECLQVGVDDQGVRGIFANGAISKDTLLLRVPPGLILDSGQRPNIARSRLSPEAAVSESVSHLLREEAKGDESLFRDWIRLLPSLEEFRSFHPYFCSSEERVALTAMCPRIFDHLSRFDRLVEGSRGRRNAVPSESAEFYWGGIRQTVFGADPCLTKPR